jgi:glycopeptide antibiotics resistance protein
VRESGRRSAPALYAPDVAKIVAFAYLIGILALTLLPVFGANEFHPVTIHLTPFHTIGIALREGVASREFALVVANLAMLVPLGVLVPRLGRPSASGVLIAAVVFSCAIELSQLAISIFLGHGYRTADVDDVILNVAGALLGYVAFRVWRARSPHPREA